MSVWVSIGYCLTYTLLSLRGSQEVPVSPQFHFHSSDLLSLHSPQPPPPEASVACQDSAGQLKDRRVLFAPQCATEGEEHFYTGASQPPLGEEEEEEGVKGEADADVMSEANTSLSVPSLDNAPISEGRFAVAEVVSLSN